MSNDLNQNVDNLQAALVNLCVPQLNAAIGPARTMDLLMGVDEGERELLFAVRLSAAGVEVQGVTTVNGQEVPICDRMVVRTPAGVYNRAH